MVFWDVLGCFVWDSPSKIVKYSQLQNGHRWSWKKGACASIIALRAACIEMCSGYGWKCGSPPKGCSIVACLDWKTSSSFCFRSCSIFSLRFAYSWRSGIPLHGRWKENPKSRFPLEAQEGFCPSTSVSMIQYPTDWLYHCWGQKKHKETIINESAILGRATWKRYLPRGSEGHSFFGVFSDLPNSSIFCSSCCCRSMSSAWRNGGWEVTSILIHKVSLINTFAREYVIHCSATFIRSNNTCVSETTVDALPSLAMWHLDLLQVRVGFLSLFLSLTEKTPPGVDR